MRSRIDNRCAVHRRGRDIAADRQRSQINMRGIDNRDLKITVNSEIVELARLQKSRGVDQQARLTRAIVRCRNDCDAVGALLRQSTGNAIR